MSQDREHQIGMDRVADQVRDLIRHQEYAEATEAVVYYVLLGSNAVWASADKSVEGRRNIFLPLLQKELCNSMSSHLADVLRRVIELWCRKVKQDITKIVDPLPSEWFFTLCHARCLTVDIKGHVRVGPAFPDLPRYGAWIG